MKKVIICVLCVAIIACAVYFVSVKYQKTENNTAENINSEVKTTVTDNEVTENVPKSEQTGTAGSNMPLKDNAEEAEYQIEVALQYLFEEIYGDKVFDARIYVEKVYTYEDEQEIDALKQMKLGPDEVAFEVKYELKPTKDANITELTIPDGEYDEETEWVTGLHRVGVLRPTESGEQKYEITDFGTGW